MQKNSDSRRLAILGGEPIRKRAWPKWPRADQNTERNVLDVLHSGRWAISGLHTGQHLYERRFAEAFAAFHKVPYAVPVCNGSAALVVALEALGVGWGDEVLVPGIVWVACASAVTRIGGIPILVDVEPDTLCMSLEAARNAITPKTRAIMLVHLYCAIGDLDGFLALSREARIPLLEDCSQAHGALWKGQRVGTFGEISAFSLQDSKLLTSGEGGIVITSDLERYRQLQQLRGDGRVYSKVSPPSGYPELEELGDIQGHNYCISEFHAAIALDRLEHLDEENKIRHNNALYLRELLASVGDVAPLRQRDEVTLPTYYHFCVRLNRNGFGGHSIEVIRRALTAELDVFIEPVDNPLNANVLYNPLRSQRIPESFRKRLDPAQFSLPVATAASGECLTFLHQVLLDDAEGMEEIARAFRKIKENQEELGLISSMNLGDIRTD